MAANRKISWKRLSIEAAAIVGSILLAFAIDAWWERAQESKREFAHLRLLHREFSSNIELLHETVSKNKRTQDAANRILAVIAEQREKPAADELVTDTWIAFAVDRFEPLTTAYENLISTGDIALIRDEQLKFDIASFMTASELYRRQESTLEQWQGPIQQFIGKEMAPLDWVIEDYRAATGLPDAGESTDWNKVLNSREFEGILVNRVIAVQDNMDRLNNVIPTTEAIVRRLDELIGIEQQ